MIKTKEGGRKTKVNKRWLRKIFSLLPRLPWLDYSTKLLNRYCSEQTLQLIPIVVRLPWLIQVGSCNQVENEGKRVRDSAQKRRQKSEKVDSGEIWQEVKEVSIIQSVTSRTPSFAGFENGKRRLGTRDCWQPPDTENKSWPTASSGIIPIW